MHSNSSVARRVAVVTGMGLVVSPVAALASPAFASGCAASTPTATEVSPNVCEVSFTSAGDYTFSVPTGVAKLSAVIVGGGGGAAFGAGGDYDMVVATSDIPGEGASTSGGFGNDGAVYLRWSAELPQTGLSASQWWSVASAFMISGAALIAWALRGRRRDLST